MDITDIPELGLIIVMLVVMLSTAGTDAYKRLASVESNKQLEDKNSSYEYSTIINGKFRDEIDLTNAIIAVIMGCNSEKLSDVTVRVILGGNVIAQKKINKGTLRNMEADVGSFIKSADIDKYTDVEYFSHLEFNLVYIDLYVSM